MSLPDPIPAPLAALATLLENEDYTVIHTPATEFSKGGELLFNALDEESEAQGRILPVRVIVLNKQMDEDALLAMNAEPVGALMLHCALVFPWSIAADRLQGVMQAVLLVNRVLPLCSYGVSMEDRSCYLNACITLQHGAPIPGPVVLETIQMICHAVQKYGPLIEQIVNGEITYTQMREALEQRGQLPPPIPVQIVTAG